MGGDMWYNVVNSLEMEGAMIHSVIGEYEYNIDNKGRLIVPPKFRSFLGNAFVLTKGLDGCLFVFPQPEWEDFEKKLRELPVADKKARAFTRFFFAGAAECNLDRQGRFSIPAPLRKFAGLQKTAVIVGVTNRIEIWDYDTWIDYNEKNTADFADQMAELGI